MHGFHDETNSLQCWIRISSHQYHVHHQPRHKKNDMLGIHDEVLVSSLQFCNTFIWKGLTDLSITFNFWKTEICLFHVAREIQFIHNQNSKIEQYIM